MTQDKDTLLPCPFCGGGHYSVLKMGYGECKDRFFIYGELVDDCILYGRLGTYIYDTKEAAIRAWNTRRDLCITREDLERMRLNEHVFDPNDERPYKNWLRWMGWNACIDELLEKIDGH